MHSNGQIISGVCALLVTLSCLRCFAAQPSTAPLQALTSTQSQPTCLSRLAPTASLIAGDRSGNVILWDTAAADVSWRMKGVHRGHVTSLVWADASDPYCAGLFLSGGQDGCGWGAGQGTCSTQCAASTSGTEACSGA